MCSICMRLPKSVRCKMSASRNTKKEKKIGKETVKATDKQMEKQTDRQTRIAGQ